MRVPVRVKLLPHGEGLPLPDYQTSGAAGADLRAALVVPVVLEPGDRTLVPCGFAMAIPEGWEVQVRPRSGLAAKFGVTMVNGPGTIDCDYRGEVQVPLVNLGREPFRIERGERIAQAVLAPVFRITWDLVEALDDDTERGVGGFGSTGRS
ncbi:MAG: dUTP diphosphatase [Myxococcota bacterium]